MSAETKLLKLKNEMKDLEKREQRLKGTLEALYTELKKALDSPHIEDTEADKMVKKEIKRLRKKREVAQGQLQVKMDIIDDKLAAHEIHHES